MAGARAEDFRAFLEGEGIVLDPATYESATLAEAGIDSLLMLQWAVLLEERSGRPLDDDLLDSLRTVGDLQHFFIALSSA